MENPFNKKESNFNISEFCVKKKRVLIGNNEIASKFN